jgi:RimJ/RimL family protein N-acetyltransferase
MQTASPYIHCPTYETGQFFFRQVRADDAPDLLECYSDPRSAPIFNSDNCTSDFIFHSLAEMQHAIGYWLAEYGTRSYVRFSIMDKARQKAVGTIEFFAKPGEYAGFGRVGLLRLDLASKYETAGDLAEIVEMIDAHFYPLFGVDCIITKAIPAAAERIRALESLGYQAIEGQPIVPYDHYYARKA